MPTKTQNESEATCKHCGEPISDAPGIFIHIRDGEKFANETIPEKRRCFLFAQRASQPNSLDEIAEYLDEQRIPGFEPLQADSCPMAYTTLERVKILKARSSEDI
jgi:hypothetical protein